MRISGKLAYQTTDEWQYLLLPVNIKKRGRFAGCESASKNVVSYVLVIEPQVLCDIAHNVV
jgi:hypothetical protein